MCTLPLHKSFTGWSPQVASYRNSCWIPSREVWSLHLIWIISPASDKKTNYKTCNLHDLRNLSCCSMCKARVVMNVSLRFRFSYFWHRHPSIASSLAPRRCSHQHYKQCPDCERAQPVQIDWLHWQIASRGSGKGSVSAGLVNGILDSLFCFSIWSPWTFNALSLKTVRSWNLFEPYQVTEADVCSIAESIYSELGEAKLGRRLKSDSFLQEVSKLSTTGHAARLYQKLEDYNLTARIPITLVDVKGLPHKHPVLSFRDTCNCLSDNGKSHLLLPNDIPLENFWDRYRELEPTHPVFKQHAGRLCDVVPTLCHADEGTSQKKRGIMIMNIQPLIGSGTSRGGAGLNFVGQSITTRFLYTTMASKLYGGKKSGRLCSLVDHLATELKSCFEDPVKVFVRGKPRQL